MPTERIPFANLQQSGHEKLGGASPAAMNVMVDANGVVRRRPGIQALTAAGTTAIDSNGIDGLFVTSTGTIYASGGTGGTRTMYRIAGGGGAPVGGTSTFVANRRPVFAETEALVVVAAGDAIYKVVLSSNAGSLLGGSPPIAGHVVFNASRLLANDLDVDRSKLNFSSPAAGTTTTGHEQWGGTGSSGFVSAEARPDPIVAVGENSNEVFAWGSTNLQVFAPDSLLDFATVASRDYGCSAPYSVVRFDQSFVWLDHMRRFVQSNGRQVQDISDAISPSITDAAVGGCFGYRVNEGMGDYLVWTLPTSGRTFAYQVGVGWGQWAAFSGGQWSEFTVTAHAHDPTTDTNIVGLSDGRVCKLQDGVADDLGDPIRAYVRTGAQNRGQARTKACQRVRFTLERGRTTAATEPLALVEWSDSPGLWSDPMPIGLGLSGETHPVVTLHGLGMYRTRDWRFTFSADEPMALVSAEEDFEWMAE